MNLIKSYLFNFGMVLTISGLILTGCGSDKKGEQGGDTDTTQTQDTSAGGMQGMQGDTATLSSSDISDDELKKFVDVSKALKKEGISKKYREKLINYMDSIGLSKERFQEISRQKQGKKGMAQLKGDTASETEEITEKEEKMYEQTQAKQEEMMPAMKKEFRQVVKEQGMDVERFKAINQAIRGDRELMMRVRKMMMGGKKGMKQKMQQKKMQQKRMQQQQQQQDGGSPQPAQ